MSNFTERKFSHRFHKDGTPSRWYQIYLYIKENGPVSHKETYRAVYGHDELKMNWRTGKKDLPARSLGNRMWADMRQCGLLEYDPSTKKWTAGELPE